MYHFVHCYLDSPSVEFIGQEQDVAMLEVWTPYII